MNNLTKRDISAEQGRQIDPCGISKFHLGCFDLLVEKYVCPHAKVSCLTPSIIETIIVYAKVLGQPDKDAHRYNTDHDLSLRNEWKLQSVGIRSIHTRGFQAGLRMPIMIGVQNAPERLEEGQELL